MLVRRAVARLSSGGGAVDGGREVPCGAVPAVRIVGCGRQSSPELHDSGAIAAPGQLLENPLLGALRAGAVG
jgi:hypothetical protein